MTDLGFDQEQLAAVLERIVFAEDDVLEAILGAKADGAAEVGVFSLQGQTQFEVRPVLSIRDGEARLHVCAFNHDLQASETGYTPEFTVVLKTADGDIMTSLRESYRGGSPIEVIPLASPARLIGARLELVA